MGLVLGQVLADRVSLGLQTELERYLENYLNLDRAQISASELAWNTLILYIRYPLVAFFSGFASVGILLLPVLAILFGLGLSFSVACFTAVFESAGLWICCASFGMRVLITLPCFFVVAIQAWWAAYRLLMLSLGRGRSRALDIYGKQYWNSALVVLGILLVGACIDFLLTPWLLKLVFT